MAKPAWVTVAPASGASNGNVAISGSAHTGRLVRNGIVTIQNVNGTKPSKSVNVSQAGKTVYANASTIEFPDVPAAGGKVTIPGKSNAAIFYIAVVALGGVPTLKLTAGGVEQLVTLKSGSAGMGVYECTIKNDVGATAEYSYTLEVTQPANTTARRVMSQITGGISLNASNGVEASFASKIYQLGAVSTLSVNPESLSLVTAGTAQSVAVTSNDDWTVA